MELMPRYRSEPPFSAVFIYAERLTPHITKTAKLKISDLKLS